MKYFRTILLIAISIYALTISTKLIEYIIFTILVIGLVIVFFRELKQDRSVN